MTLHLFVPAALGLTGLLGLTPGARGQETTLASVDSSGRQSQGDTISCALSADGHVVAFVSSGNDLVPGDTNGAIDVFVHDRTSGVTERINLESGGKESNGNCDHVAISGDGNIVAFDTFASDIVKPDGNGDADVFVVDRTLGTMTCISVDAAGLAHQGDSFVESISADGRFVVFRSLADGLVGSDANHLQDVFLFDRTTGVLELVSVALAGTSGNGISAGGAVSDDGNRIAFSSGSDDLVAGDSNGDDDVFVRDRTNGKTLLASVGVGGVAANGPSQSPAISRDGHLVGFFSWASNLVATDTNGTFDAFARDLGSGTNELLSVDSDGKQIVATVASPMSLSGDGRYVLFGCLEPLIPADQNGMFDVYVRDRQLGMTSLVSIRSDFGQGDGWSVSDRNCLSRDGSVLAFESVANNLVDPDTSVLSNDLFIHERCMTNAASANYGAGFPGTLGVPGLTLSAAPLLHQPVDLQLGDSSGVGGPGLLLVGLASASIPTRLGGDILVVPNLFLPVAIAAGGSSLAGGIPPDDRLCGMQLFAQLLEVDRGAAHGVSFSAGLEMTIGR